MGSAIEWHCNDCGAGESLNYGGGMFDINSPSVVDRSEDGTYGPAMKALFAGGIPEGWTVFSENTYYLCPSCDGLIGGSSLRIDDGTSTGWLVYHKSPGPCPHCGMELLFWDDKTPLSERELVARCEQVFKQGCPKCGSKSISLSATNWD